METMPRAICCCVYALMRGPTEENVGAVEEFEGEMSRWMEEGEDGREERFNAWREEYAEQLEEGDEEEQRERVRRYLVMRMGKRAARKAMEERDVTNYQQCQKVVSELKKELGAYWKCMK